MARSRLAVVIPCHNEAATLGAVVKTAAQFADVIVVDDRSTDASADIARTAGAEIVASAAPGYDGGLVTGLRHALARGYAFIVTMDGDGEHDPAALGGFAAAFQEGADLVLGRRQGGPQRAAEHLAAAVSRLCFGVADPFCGMKGYSPRVLQAFFASKAPLAVNLMPAFLWLRSGGGFAGVAVGGEIRQGRPRFGRALKANWALMRAFAAAMTAPPRI
jgi:glycosyltransferase involved in cell wall biosynthesis